MTDRVFVDTNVFGYLFDNDSPAKQQAASQLIADLGRARSMVLSTQVMQELYVTLTRKLEVSADLAHQALSELASYPVVRLDPPLILQATLLSRRRRISLWDALIIEAAVEGDCHEVVTEDLQDGWEVRGLRVRNPFSGL